MAGWNPSSEASWQYTCILQRLWHGILANGHGIQNLQYRKWGRGRPSSLTFLRHWPPCLARSTCKSDDLILKSIMCWKFSRPWRPVYHIVLIKLKQWTTQILKINDFQQRATKNESQSGQCKSPGQARYPSVLRLHTTCGIRGSVRGSADRGSKVRAA